MHQRQEAVYGYAILDCNSYLQSAHFLGIGEENCKQPKVSMFLESHVVVVRGSWKLLKVKVLRECGVIQAPQVSVILLATFTSTCTLFAEKQRILKENSQQ